MRYIELLSPARDIECGIAAIDHGADAVYIGARRYGARADAGNGTEDIADLCRYAHQYGARVYVALNTILYDSELEDTRNLACDGKERPFLQGGGLQKVLRGHNGQGVHRRGQPGHLQIKTEKPFPMVFVGKPGRGCQCSPEDCLIRNLFHSTTS